MIDLVLGSVILASTVLGVLRGFVGIVVGTLSWLLAGWVAIMCGGDVAVKFAHGGHPDMTAYVGGYASTFVATMVAVALIGWLIKAFVRKTPLSGVDRLAGAGLGLVRGGLIACVLVLLLSSTPLAQHSDWRQSRVLPVLGPPVAWMRSQMPDLSVPASMADLPGIQDINSDLGTLDFNKRPLSGDNGVLNDSLKQAATSLPHLGQTVSEALGNAGEQPSNGLPSPLNDPATPHGGPATARTNERDPARVAASPTGQERSP